MRERVKKALEEKLNKTHDSGNRRFSDLALYYKAEYLIPAEYHNNVKTDGMLSHKKNFSILKPLEAYFNDYLIEKINYTDIKDYRKSRLTTKVNKKIDGETVKANRSIASVNRELEILRRMFNIAIQKKWLTENPFNAGENLISKAAENVRDIIPTTEEEIKILAACEKSKSPYIKLFVIASIDTGARSNELFNSKRADYDLENKIVTLVNKKGKKIRIKKMFVTERLEKALLNYGIENLKPSDPVFPVKKLQTAWEGVRNRAGLPHLRIHDLRHLFASNMSFLGVSREAIGNLIGHSPKDAAITDRYINLNDEMLRLTKEIADKRNELVRLQAES